MRRGFQGAVGCKISRVTRIGKKELFKVWLEIINYVPFKVLKEIQIKIGLVFNYF